jgi:hypothetical protein
MSLFGNGFRNMADKIIGLSGQSLTLTRRSGSTYNPATGVSITATSVLVKGAILPYESFRHSGFRTDVGLDVQQGDLIALVSAIAATGKPLASPRPGDTIETTSVVYAVVSVAPHAPAGVDLLYMCTIRGTQ